ncbi:unnamed protein product [Triticum turgidum subsp. durum]|uniref:F-box domain-containing protein n=1 Tax=Triticum turgidum subsp. durum TaxID=4567 RepID=A0A9R1QVD1_TRITD|nr:unnamed protein product [Triticum turgidum subsp. durum]
MAGGVDRLSDLPDELLLRVLHFVPGKQAAATTALSRRWRSPLWQSSGAVNLETDVEDCGWDNDLSSSRRDAFVAAAEAALDAADVPVTRLTLRVTGKGKSIDVFLNGRWDVKLPLSSSSRYHGALAKLLSHRAVSRVEELRLDAEDSESDRRTYGACWEACSDDEINLSSLGVYVFNLGLVPSENLRMLDLTNCSDLVPAASAVVFPRLSSLRLHHGTVRLDALQSLIYAAPALATVHFESVIILPPTDREPDSGSPIYHQWDFINTSLLPPAEALLRLPAATVLALERCNWKNSDGSLRHYIVDKAGIVPAEIDAPRLRRFSEERRAELLPTFSILQRLELHGVHRPKGKTVAVAIANQLRCCPMLHDLRINLTADHHYLHYWREHDDENCFLERKFSADREKSIDLLTRHRNSKPTAMSPEGNDAANYNEVSEIPGLSQHSFDCLGSSLARVALQFRLGAANCLGAKLIKFFAENAMVLEEMFIEDGNTKLWEHISYKVEKLISDSSIRRKPGASSFVVLPLRGDLTINSEN